LGRGAWQSRAGARRKIIKGPTGLSIAVNAPEGITHLVELADALELCDKPLHPYTQALLARHWRRNPTTSASP
jgi:hypothetical protein